MPFVPAIPLADVPEGATVYCEVAGTPLLIHNVGGAIHATSDTCCHVGGPLKDGTRHGEILICPYHLWQYDVTTGACLVVKGARLLTYAVRVEGEQVEVDPEPLTEPGA